MRVARVAHDALIDEFGGNVGVDDTDDEGRHNDKRERGLLVFDDAQGAEGWSSGVLAQVSESDCGRHDEQEQRDACQDSERFGEILWPFHLRNEGWEEDLRNPEEGDVEHGVHACYPCCAWTWEGVSSNWTLLWVRAAVTKTWSILDSCKDKEEKDRYCHAECYSVFCQLLLLQICLHRNDSRKENVPENMDINDTWLRVLGMDMTMPINVTITENTTVQSE